MASPHSANPCHTCRRKRLRCDGKQPACQKCESHGVECLGYGAQPFFWVQPENRVSPESRRSQAITTTKHVNTARSHRKKLGRPKLVLMQQSDGSTHQEQDPKSSAQLPYRHKNPQSGMFLSLVEDCVRPSLAKRCQLIGMIPTSKRKRQ
jgi:hypothetical protein